jgi:hypothetical protein
MEERQLRRASFITLPSLRAVLLMSYSMNTSLKGNMSDLDALKKKLTNLSV